MSDDKDGLPFSNIRQEIPPTAWGDGRLMTPDEMRAVFEERMRDMAPAAFRIEQSFVAAESAFQSAIQSSIDVRAIETALMRYYAAPVLRIDTDPDGQQVFTAIESTFDDLTTWGEAKPMTLADINAAVERQLTAPSPARKPRMILVSPQEAAALAQWRAMDEQTVATTRVYQDDIAEPVPEVGHWLSVPSSASDDERLRHVADYDRTRITPGADPRDGWASGDAPSEAQTFLGSTFEKMGKRGAVLIVTEFGTSLPGCNYVPHDVCRWRDPTHRAELTRRAREYAECAQTLVDR